MTLFQTSSQPYILAKLMFSLSRNLFINAAYRISQIEITIHLSILLPFVANVPSVCKHMKKVFIVLIALLATRKMVLHSKSHLT